MVKRKLTTVFCADVQHYGRLMARDEAATLARLQRYRSIMENLFARRDGRKVNTWGDAVIAEFASVVEAVRCAVEIQEAISAENRDLPEDEQMWFRIGINLGDVMEDNGDIYGDGVNMASRLEALAEPGGVLVSESVYNFTHRQLAIGFDPTGPRAVKGEDAPINGYRVRIGGRNAPRDDAGKQEASRSADLGSMHATGEKEAAHHNSPVRQAAAFVERFIEWFAGQDRGVRVSVTMIGFFFLINLLFSGIATPWFIFPSLPFALHVLMKLRRKKAP